MLHATRSNSSARQPRLRSKLRLYLRVQCRCRRCCCVKKLRGCCCSTASPASNLSRLDRCFEGPCYTPSQPQLLLPGKTGAQLIFPSMARGYGCYFGRAFKRVSAEELQQVVARLLPCIVPLDYYLEDVDQHQSLA